MRMRDPYSGESAQGIQSAILNASKDSKEHCTIVLMAGDSILMGQRRDSLLWTLPGGHKKENESDYQAAVRELYEEAGIQLDQLHKLGSKLNDKGHLVHVFKGEMLPNVPGNRDITNKYDPDQEIKLWKWLRIGSPEFNSILKVLHHPKNIALEMIGAI